MRITKEKSQARQELAKKVFAEHLKDENGAKTTISVEAVQKMLFDSDGLKMNIVTINNIRKTVLGEPITEPKKRAPKVKAEAEETEAAE